MNWPVFFFFENYPLKNAGWKIMFFFEMVPFQVSNEDRRSYYPLL